MTKIVHVAPLNLTARQVGEKSLKGNSTQKYIFFISPVLIQSQNVLYVSSQVFKMFDFQEAKCHGPHHHDDTK